MLIIDRFKELEKKRIFAGFKSYLWKISGFLGNRFFNKPAPDIKTKEGLRLLNLGCGTCHYEGWVNADFYRLNNLIYNRHLLPNWMLDLTVPLNCESDYWDGVLIEHVNEHLLYSQNYDLFKEVFRTMKVGGTCRIILPDLDRYLNWSELREIEPKMSRYSSLAEAVSNLTQNHSHISVWNFDLLSEVLEDIGFTNIKISSFGKASVDAMNVDTKSHQWESLYVEAHK